MVIKRKLRNSTGSTSTSAPEVKSEEIKTPSPTPPVKVERRGRPRKSDSVNEEVTNDKPVKASRPAETFKIIPFNPKSTTNSNKGKEKEAVYSPTEPPSEPMYNDPQQFESNFVTLPEAPVFSPLPQQQMHTTSPLQEVSTYSGNILQSPRNTRPRRWIRRKVVIKTTGAEIAVPVWYSNEPKQLNNYGTS